MKNTNVKVYTYSRRQKIFAWVALVGIFVCGMMAGAFMWEKKSAHTPDSGVSNTEKMIRFVERNTMPCLDKEAELQKTLTENNHFQNVRVYEKLSQIGCEMNREKYENFAKSERELAEALNYVYYPNEIPQDENERPCEVIERSLLYKLGSCDDCHLDNAEIYSKIAEDGCAENTQKYTQKALDELQIAEGVRMNDTDIDNGEIRATVNTYKKLQMQNEAKKYINKVEKLVNPGIDFILELQRIIEE